MSERDNSCTRGSPDMCMARNFYTALQSFTFACGIVSSVQFIAPNLYQSIYTLKLFFSKVKALFD